MLCGRNLKAVPICPLGLYYPQAPRRSALRPHCVNIELQSDPPATESPCVVEPELADYSNSDSDSDVQDELVLERRQQCKSAAAVTRDSAPTPRLRVSRAKTAVTFCSHRFNKVEDSNLSEERTRTPGWGISNRDRMRPTSISMDRSLKRHRWLHSAPPGFTKNSKRMIFLTELGELHNRPVTYDCQQFENTEKKSIPTHLYSYSTDDVTAASQRAWQSKYPTTTEHNLRQQQYSHSCEQHTLRNNSAPICEIRGNRKTLLELLVFAERNKTGDVTNRRKRFYRNISNEKSVNENEESEAFMKFKMVACMTLKMVVVMRGIIANSDHLTIRSAAEQQWYILYSNRNSHKLAFNKSFYTRERAINKMPAWALKILEKRPDERRDQECRRVQVLLKGMRSFDKFTEKLQLSLCRAFTLDRVTEGRVILRQGHIGQNFYLVYSGSVFVNVNDVTSSGERFTKTEAVLSRGDSFGELALLKDIKRTATIAVRESCELLVVNKTVFSKVCPKIFERELEEKEEILRRNQLFIHRWWTNTALRNLCLEAYIQEYPTNQVIVTNSQYEDWIYICVEGKCDVIRCLELKQAKPRPGSRLSSRRSTVILSDEVIDLLKTFTPSGDQEKMEIDSEGDDKNKNIKHRLLGTLALEYSQSQNHKRSKAFIEEVEENEKKKALEAASGPVTLATYMKGRLAHNGADVVFLHIGVLMENEVFDLSCIASPQERIDGSPMMLVSVGAKMLKIHREKFYEFASNSALEHAKGVASTCEKYPSDASLLHSYRSYSMWKAYRMDLVKEIKTPGFRASAHLVSKLKDGEGKQRLQRWQQLERLMPQRRKVYSVKRTENEKTDHKPHTRTVTFGRPMLEPERNEWVPEVERTVPENIVLRRHSDVGLPRRPSVAEPTVTLPRKCSNIHYNDDIISEEDEDKVEPDTTRRKSVSIKLD
ncbi:uncharacterized protein LOC121381506 [Gigantopelta aegis]|uniref:uncharacterized protein LOC121381506 n=1 Tax=Gigantopelta aegis TaxID=1735272 RepID=UPI001B88A975|nr:uncharacterized protein LOC121381506 [Gigantopelta aegis]